MRVALLQIRLDPKSRAANLQALTSWIDRAADASPAPDLLVLPGACDTGGAPSVRGWSEGILHAVRESIAWKAREWGVFIAAGVHISQGARLEPCAVLFDPDGDVVVRSVSSESLEQGESVAPPAPWSSVIGDVGVMEPTLVASFAQCASVTEQGAVIAVPTCGSAVGKRRRAADATVMLLRDDASMGCGIFWAIVAPAEDGDVPPGDGKAPGTFLRGPKGEILASANGRNEMIVHADAGVQSV